MLHSLWKTPGGLGDGADRDHVLAAVPGGLGVLAFLGGGHRDLGAAHNAAEPGVARHNLGRIRLRIGGDLELAEGTGPDEVDGERRDEGCRPPEHPPERRDRDQCRGDHRESVTPQPSRSRIVALAIPPPSHMVWSPYRPPVRSSSFSSVAISRAPEHPRGCPSALAPPLTFTRLMSGWCSCSQASTTGAKASLISTRSMSSRVSFPRSNALVVAGIGPVSIMTGSTPANANAWKRARGTSPKAL